MYIHVHVHVYDRVLGYESLQVQYLQVMYDRIIDVNEGYESLQVLSTALEELGSKNVKISN